MLLPRRSLFKSPFYPSLKAQHHLHHHCHSETPPTHTTIPTLLSQALPPFPTLLLLLIPSFKHKRVSWTQPRSANSKIAPTTPCLCSVVKPRPLVAALLMRAATTRSAKSWSQNLARLALWSR